MNVLVAGIDQARVSDWIRQHALRAAGALPLTKDEVAKSVAHKLDPPGLAEHLTVPEPADLRTLRRNRLVMGTIRYEYSRNAVDRSRSGHIQSSLARWEEYEKTGNREHLVDIANLVAIEWAYPNRPWTKDPLCLWLNRVDNNLRYYTAEGWPGCLPAAIDAVRREWANPTHPNAHWQALDNGGHWSLRNLPEEPLGKRIVDADALPASCCACPHCRDVLTPTSRCPTCNPIHEVKYRLCAADQPMPTHEADEDDE